ncbi:hypothetical protein Tco_0721079 [Tanacetum coccineum]
MFVEFVFQNQLFSFSLEEFGQILRISYEDDCSFSDKWSLDDFPYSVPTGGPYQTNPPSPDDIKLLFQIERRCEQKIIVEDNQILTREITDVMKTWVDIIRKNVFCLLGNRDHVPVCLCHMLFCIASSTHYNLAYFIAKRMEFVTKQARLILPYERKTRKDYGTRRDRSSTSSLSAFGRPSSSHPNDDDNDGNDKRTLRETLLPPLKVSEKPLDSLDLISKTFDITITNPLFDLYSEFTLNSDNPIFDIQNEESDESETETIMEEVQRIENKAKTVSGLSQAMPGYATPPSTMSVDTRYEVRLTCQYEVPGGGYVVADQYEDDTWKKRVIRGTRS